MFKKIISILLCTALLSTSMINTTFADSSINSTDTFDMKISKINENTYITKVKIDGNIIESTSLKDSVHNIVTISTIRNGVLLKNETVALDDLSEVGIAFKNSDVHNFQLKADSLSTNNYIFDGVSMSPTSRTQPYDHPDKILYNISPNQNWHKEGYSKHFIQFNKYDSNSWTQVPAWVIGAAIGAVLTGYLTASPYGAAAGGIIGAFVGAYIGGQVGRVLDEDNCFWLIVDKQPTNINGKLRLNYLQMGNIIRTDIYLDPLSN